VKSEPPQPPKPRERENYCVRCRQWLLVSMFAPANTRSGLEIWCRWCQP
jgi:hypothetical protein